MLLEVTILIWVLSLFYLYLRKPSNYPPGPWGFPLIGWPPRSFEDFNRELVKYKEQKKDVIGWRIGTRFIVVILDYDLFVEAFQHPNIAIRPDLGTIVFLRAEKGKYKGLSLARGNHSKQNRRLTLRHFRDFGMGKEKLLLDAHYEADELVNVLSKQVGKSTSLSLTIQTSVLNNVWQMIGSIRYKFGDEEISKYNELLSKWHDNGLKMTMLDIFPWLRKILPTFILDFIFKIHIQREISDQMKTYFMKHINNHIKDLKEENVRDFIDTYLLEMEKQKNNSDSTMSVEDLVFCLSDLFEGATATVGGTIDLALFYMAKFPRIQENLQKEIDEVVPKGTQYQLKDKINLPYTEAFINEVLRHSSIVASNPREAIEDTKVGSYIIPKGSWVFGNQFFIHYDPKIWETPSEFRPERFLDSNNKFVTPTSGFVPFGMGRRFCPGEGIARMQLLVIITKLIQNFNFGLAPGEKTTIEIVTHPIFRPLKRPPKMLITTR